MKLQEIITLDNIKYIVSKIFNYNDVDYYELKNDNNEYKLCYEDNSEVKELLDLSILEKLTLLRPKTR